MANLPNGFSFTSEERRELAQSIVFDILREDFKQTDYQEMLDTCNKDLVTVSRKISDVWEFDEQEINEFKQEKQCLLRLKYRLKRILSSENLSN